MKRVSGFILTVTLALFIINQGFSQSTTVTAENKDNKQATPTAQNCGKFVDSNKDGVCDNFGNRGEGSKGMNFVDANGDGICDHHADGTNVCKGNQHCCKQNGGASQNGCKAAQNCGGKGKGMGEQHKHGCENQNPGQIAPDKK